MYFLLLFICLFLFIFNVTFDFQNKSVKYNFPQIHLASIQQERMAMKITMRSSLAVLAGLTVEMYSFGTCRSVPFLLKRLLFESG